MSHRPIEPRSPPVLARSSDHHLDHHCAGYGVVRCGPLTFRIAVHLRERSMTNSREHDADAWGPEGRAFARPLRDPYRSAIPSRAVDRSCPPRAPPSWRVDGGRRVGQAACAWCHDGGQAAAFRGRSRGSIDDRTVVRPAQTYFGEPLRTSTSRPGSAGDAMAWSVGGVVCASPRGLSGLGNAAGVAAGIVGGCFDPRGRKWLRCVGEQLRRIVGHRLMWMDDRAGSRSGSTMP
jgi:hypothetical protein